MPRCHASHCLSLSCSVVLPALVVLAELAEEHPSTWGCLLAYYYNTTATSPHYMYLCYCTCTLTTRKTHTLTYAGERRIYNIRSARLHSCPLTTTRVSASISGRCAIQHSSRVFACCTLHPPAVTRVVHTTYITTKVGVRSAKQFTSEREAQMTARICKSNPPCIDRHDLANPLIALGHLTRL